MSDRFVEVDGVLQEAPGQAALWAQFGLTRAAWLTLPRVLMHEMPDDWQQRMAQLLVEFYDTWDVPPEEVFDISVIAKRAGRVVPMPGWIDYRHPNARKLASFKAQA